MKKLFKFIENYIYDFLVYRIGRYPFRWIKEIYWFIQKIDRGYSDCDLWGLYDHLSDIILPRLKSFRYSSRKGVPSSFVLPMDDNELTESTKNWNKTLDKMIFAFEYISSNEGFEKWFVKKYGDVFQKDERYKIKTYSDEECHYNRWLHEEFENRCQEGLELFGRYFRNLWD